MAPHSHLASGVQSSTAWQAYQNLRGTSTLSSAPNHSGSPPAWAYQTYVAQCNGQGQSPHLVYGSVRSAGNSSNSSGSISVSGAPSCLSDEPTGFGGCLRTSISVSNLQRGTALSRGKSPVSGHDAAHMPFPNLLSRPPSESQNQCCSTSQKLLGSQDKVVWQGNVSQLPFPNLLSKPLVDGLKKQQPFSAIPGSTCFFAKQSSASSSVTSGSTRSSPHGSMRSSVSRRSMSSGSARLPAVTSRPKLVARSASVRLPVQHQAQSSIRSSSEQTFCRDRTADTAMSSEEMESRPTMCVRGETLTGFGASLQEVSKFVQVVSLGNSCATKLSMRRLDVDEATLPLDWIRSSIDGLIHWLKHDFEGFRNGGCKYHLILKDCAMTVHRSSTHSFWHDNLEDDATQEKLQRRVQRFLDLAQETLQHNTSANQDTSEHNSPRALLFVRSVACSSELPKIEQLLQILRQRFESKRRKVYLLVVIDGQPFAGPILHATHEERLLFWIQPTFSGELTLDCSSPAPYEEAIAFALRRILQSPGEEDDSEWPRVEQAADIVRENGSLWKLGVRSTDAGLWVGNVLLRGALEETRFAAFEGVDDNAPILLSTAGRASMPPRMSPKRRAHHAWLGA